MNYEIRLFGMNRKLVGARRKLERGGEHFSTASGYLPTLFIFQPEWIRIAFGWRDDQMMLRCIWAVDYDGG